MKPYRIAFLVSGNGTLFEYIARKCEQGEIAASPSVVISSTASAKALERAAGLGIASVVIARGKDESDETHAATLLAALREHGADLVCLAGYLKLLPAAVVREYRGRVLNIHPALLPAFGGNGMYGRRVHEAVIAYGARVSGATVHIVDEVYDHGPVVAQRAVFVHPEDNPETLAERVHAVEFELYAQAVSWFAQSRVRIDGRKVTILPLPQ
jgi:phosphoribosylglycinamide formyltransferase 1